MKGWLGFVMVTLLLFVGCKGEKGPGESLVEYLNAVQQGDYEVFVSGLAKSGFETTNIDSVVVHLLDANKRLMEERYGGVKSYEIVSVVFDEDGDSATVRVKILFGDQTSEETEYKMIKENDTWKVNLAS